jgi:hypothetical protein
MEIQREIERIVRLRDSEVGPTEENVKQKVVVPLLELLGHKKDDLEFEYRTRRGGKIDILVAHVPSDCKVIIDTKNYTENLGDHIEQIKEYTFDEAALIAILANGTEMRLYSPLRGIAFERSLLYCLRRDRLSDQSVWNILWELVGYENLRSRHVLRTIADREQEIKDAMLKEEHIRQEVDDQIGGIEADIELKEEEIEDLKNRKEQLEKDASEKTSAIWKALGLPMNLFGTYPIPPTAAPGPNFGGDMGKARKVTLQELVAAGFIRDGAPLYFHHTRLPHDEVATIVASQNRLKYKDHTYSISKLAEILLKKHGFKRDAHSVAGPQFWKTRDGKLLDDLNDQVRARR